MAQSSNSNKTVPTEVDPREFINTANTTEARRADARTLLDTIEEVTGEPPLMWGPSIIGFGEYHYTYDSGREGTAAAVGFSPRKAHLVVYGLTYPEGAPELLTRLGKFKSGAACIYINKLADVDLEVLRALVALAYKHFTTQDIKSLQSQQSQRGK